MKRKTISRAWIANHVIKYLHSKGLSAMKDKPRWHPNHIVVYVNDIHYSLSCNMFREVSVQRKSKNTDPSWPLPYVPDERFPERCFTNLYQLYCYLVTNSRKQV